MMSPPIKPVMGTVLMIVPGAALSKRINSCVLVRPIRIAAGATAVVATQKRMQPKTRDFMTPARGVTFLIRRPASERQAQSSSPPRLRKTSAKRSRRRSRSRGTVDSRPVPNTTGHEGVPAPKALLEEIYFDHADAGRLRLAPHL